MINNTSVTKKVSKRSQRFETATISTQYFRGERTVKVHKKDLGSMLTLEKALERMAARKATEVVR